MKILLTLMLMTMVPLGAVSASEPFACNLNALTKTERARHQRLSKALRSGVEEEKELRDGYAFRLAPRMFMTVAEWVSLERRCCPFFAFELEQSKDNGPLWLRITGAKGANEFMRAEFDL